MAKLKTLGRCACTCEGCCCKASVNSVKGSPNEHSVQANGDVVERDRPFTISCEWDKNKTHQFSDDGTNTFFWQAHTLTVLIGMLCVLVYVALFESAPFDSQYNTKRGLFACVMVFLLFGVTQIRDSSFKRPHPGMVIINVIINIIINNIIVIINIINVSTSSANVVLQAIINIIIINVINITMIIKIIINIIVIKVINIIINIMTLIINIMIINVIICLSFWRLMLCLSVLYELVLIYILFQTLDDARMLLKHVDDKLGKPLPETLYCQNCELYTPGHPDGPFHNFMDKCDFFVFCHLVGWWAKWILDVLLCNGIGTYLGMKTCDYLAIKPFHWRGLYNIPTYKGKLKRVAEQFTPYSWTPYDWGATHSLKGWLAVCGIATVFLTAELTMFYMKFILWLKPPHALNFIRVILLMFCGCLAFNETYEYMHDKNCKRFGQQAWVIAAIIATEVLICLKFGWDIITIPFPAHVIYFWIVFVICWLSWTIWHFWPKKVHQELKHSKVNGKSD
ncbi:hypothetical protein QZH41_019309 [Actinostola sp. cb2023]|nr:hypothetical protein QZH41_019309 [Actinostola sp. cb2023]